MQEINCFINLHIKFPDFEELKEQTPEEVFKFFDDWIDKNKNLSYFLNMSIDLSNANLHYVPDALCKLEKLSDLNLSNNKLTILPENFGDNLPNLTILNLSGNNLKELPESFDKLAQLSKLIISKNNLSELPENFGNLTNLYTLDLSKNNLTELPKSFANFNKLITLNLLNNQFKTYPEYLNKLKLIALKLDEK